MQKKKTNNNNNKTKIKTKKAFVICSTIKNGKLVDCV